MTEYQKAPDLSARPVNDNPEAPPHASSTIADLAAALGVDEDTVLQRIASVLARRHDAKGGK